MFSPERHGFIAEASIDMRDKETGNILTVTLQIEKASNNLGYYLRGVGYAEIRDCRTRIDLEIIGPFKGKWKGPYLNKHVTRKTEEIIAEGIKASVEHYLDSGFEFFEEE